MPAFPSLKTHKLTRKGKYSMDDERGHQTQARRGLFQIDLYRELERHHLPSFLPRYVFNKLSFQSSKARYPLHFR